MLGGALAGLLVLGCAAQGQTPDSSARIQALEKQLDTYRRVLKDWAGLIRYGSEGAEVPPPAPGEDRVVFLGDEVTEQWRTGNAKFFPGKPYFNRGIQIGRAHV